MSSSDSSSDSSFFSSSASAAAPPAAAPPAAAGAAPPPTLVIKSSMSFLSKSLAKRVGQYGSTSTPAALTTVAILSAYGKKKQTKKKSQLSEPKILNKHTVKNMLCSTSLLILLHTAKSTNKSMNDSSPLLSL